MTVDIPTKHLATVLANHTVDLAGRVAAITGTTSGTGYVCARELARLGAEVVLLNRPSDRAAAALARLRDALPEGRFVSVDCDLQSFDSVRQAAASLRERFARIDILCNNAGVMALPDQATMDGYGVQMQTNCLSHFLLTRELWPLLLASDDARVVNHTSGARLGPPLEEMYFERRGGDLGGDGTAEENARFGGPRWMRYHQTKLANCCFTYELKARLEAAGIHNVKALLAHPGLARTQLQITTGQTGGMDAYGAFMDNAQSAEDGATGIIRACADPTASSGAFYGPRGWSGFPDLLQPEELLLDAENRRINWDGCEAAVGAFRI